MSTRITRSTAQSFRFYDLPLEIQQQILDHLVTKRDFITPDVDYTAVIPLLSVSRDMAKFARHHIFQRVALPMGSPDFRERLLLSLSEEGARCVSSDSLSGLLHIAALDFQPSAKHLEIMKEGFWEEDANQLLTGDDIRRMSTPYVKGLNKAAVTNVVCDFLTRITWLRALSLQVSLEGMREEEREENSDLASRLEVNLRNLAELIHYTINVTHPNRLRQCLGTERSDVTPAFLSPALSCLTSWQNLAGLTLCNITFVLPSTILHRPTYQLQQLKICDCNFGSLKEILWLGGNLEHLRILIFREIEFLDSPNDSSPLIECFLPGGHPPLFAKHLKDLSLQLRYPITGVPRAFLTSLTALRILCLEGPGITPSILTSLLPHQESPRTPSPSTNLKSLYFDALTSVPLPFISNFLRTNTFTHLRHLYFSLPLSYNYSATALDSPFSTWRLEPIKEWNNIKRWSRGIRKLKLRKNWLNVDSALGRESDEDSEAEEEGEEDELWEPPEEEEVFHDQEESVSEEDSGDDY